MLSRTSKRLIIGSVYVFIILLIVGGGYWSNNRPTCNDNIQNGREEGVDCGTLACGQACVAPIQALVVQDIQWVRTPINDLDVAILIYNPNVDYGTDLANYDLVIFDNAGKEISREAYSFYMLAGQTKYIALTSLKNIPDGAFVGVEVRDVNWQKISSPVDVEFIIAREATMLENNQTTYQAVITNNSNFDFDMIDVNIVVKNSAGLVVATNKTNFQTFVSRDSRSISVVWPFVLPTDARIQTEVGTNIFKNNNFLKQNGTQEKFQQYY